MVGVWIVNGRYSDQRSIWDFTPLSDEGDLHLASFLPSLASDPFPRHSFNHSLVQHFPPGERTTRRRFLTASFVLALLFHGEGLTRHFHFDKRPTDNTPCHPPMEGADGTVGERETTPTDHLLPFRTSPIKQYLLYCTRQWIWTEILHNVIFVRSLVGSSLDVRLSQHTPHAGELWIWRQYFIGAFNGTFLMAAIRPF